MFFDFGFNPFQEEEMDTYILEIKMGNQIQRQTIMGSDDMVQLQFIQLMQETGNSAQPYKIKLIRQDRIWDNYNSKERILNNYLQFANKKYMETFPDEFKEV